MKKLKKLNEIDPIMGDIIKSIMAADRTEEQKASDKAEVTAAHSMALALINRDHLLRNDPAVTTIYMTMLEDFVGFGDQSQHLSILTHEPEGSQILGSVLGTNVGVGAERMVAQQMLQQAIRVLQAGADAILAHLSKIGVYAPPVPKMIAA